MRSLLARLAIIGTVGAAITGCGTTSGSSLPIGGFPNGSGGGPVNVSNQAAPTAIFAGKLIDGGILTVDGKYTGFNTAATDTQSPLENGTDTANAAAQPPADPAAAVNGSHAISFAGSGVPQIELLFNNIAPISLTIPANQLPGQILPQNYGAVVFFAKTTPSAALAPASGSPSYSLEITGGAGSTAFDTRIACPQKQASTATPAPTAVFLRYVCPLPAYGATVTQPAESPVAAGATTGTFTPTAVKLYIVLTYGAATTTTSTGNTLALDTIYAEAGTN